MPCERTIHSLEARVAANRALGAGYWRLTLEAPEIAAEFSDGRARAGQFVNVGFPRRTDPLLARPFAVFDARAKSGEVDVLFKRVGRGTGIMAGLAAGDSVRLVGPLGKPWRAETGSTDVSILVAGGTGWAAIRMLARSLAEAGHEVCAIWGQCDADAFPEAREVGAEGVEMVLATDDGSCGFCGTTVDCLRDLVERELAGKRAALYGAGPVPMLKALADFAAERGLPCQVSLEARMACGIGVCRACVVNAKEPHAGTGLRRRAVCRDGPVFDADEIDWEDLR
jgi:dihydroorotate dehydrogenase electron transfer subunit